ncbi:septation protein SepH [Nocardioides houyundeii]|uniref:septation protein SepH n=1 Tax=Nocardioides houyundeii TaxID=2045452 RepID=UPI0013B45159|nr:septation protein SepH [Nocardioides houyundeii]
MAHLTLVGLSDDRTRLLLVDDTGVEHTVDVDAPLRAALRATEQRPGHLEKRMDSAIRPRDIQARIRAGETPEAVAEAADSTVEKIMIYAAPVLAEREHVAGRAQLSSVRRRSAEGSGSLGGGRSLGETVSAHLRASHIDPGAVEWDAWRREDGRWTLVGTFSTEQRSGRATFSYDVPGNYVTVDDDDARWLVGEATAAVETDAPSAPETPVRRRLSSVPTDELPLGDDAIELVSEDPAPEHEDRQRQARVDHEDDATMDLTDSLPLEGLDESPAGEPGQDPRKDPARETGRETGADPAAADAAPAEEPASAKPEEAPRRPVKKSRGRASVPSWDEIMFGGGTGD